MPPNTATLRVGPYFLSLLLVLVAMFGLVFLPGQRHTPKLGLDLEGGATVTLQAQTTNGKNPSSSAMRVARQILENRVNGKGVSAAQVFQQGNDEIVISVPGANAQQIAKVGQAAKLNYRPVIFAAVPNTTAATSTAPASASGTTGTAAPTSGATGTGTAPSTSAPKSTTPKATTTAPKATTSPNGLFDAKDAPTTGKSSAAKTSAAKTTAAKSTAATTTAATTPTPTATPTATKLSADPFKNLGFTLPKTDTAFNALTPAQQAALTTALGNFDCSTKPPDVPSLPLAACDNSTPPGYKYLLGPVIVKGTEISSADAVAPSTGTGGNPSWTVSINLKDAGQTAWTNFTGAHHDANTSGTDSATTCSASTVPCFDFVAFTLDGVVISTPVTEGTINGTTQVSGSFTESSAKDLADDLKYGALPLNFKQLTAQDISATLGTSQLKAGLLAGGIGLALVVIYSFMYYRGLGFVTVFSLIVSGGLTYASLVILGREIGFTLTLAGIAGFIVAVGITADSFVVLFERLKDEVHSGRSLRVAVPRAWTRARRTILSADTVSFLAAAVLYYFTVGDVRGFAFTLGLSTLLDIAVVFLFTHPLVSLLSRSSAFGSPRFTGLNSVREGGIAPSPEGHVRPARSQPPRGSSAKGAKPAGAIALLERDDVDDSDVDEGFAAEGYDDEVVGVAPVATPTTPEESVGDSGVPRRSRVVPRSAPAAEISADAAERAAARRGRRVRPPKPVAEEPVEEEPVDEIDDADESDAVSATNDVLAADQDHEPAPDVSPEPVVLEPEPAAVAEDASASAPTRGRPAARTTSPTTAAERAAARRRDGRVPPARPVKPAPEPGPRTDGGTDRRRRTRSGRRRDPATRAGRRRVARTGARGE